MKGEVRQMPAVTFISLVFLSSPAAVTFISLVFRCFQADESLSLLSIAGIFFNFLKTQAKISGHSGIFFNFLKTQAKISGDLEKTEKQAVRCLRSVLSFAHSAASPKK